MLVAHASDHITHAIIGGKKAVNFGISDDPAFFQILSSALYKNPTLAMVRETICNAWDAHIDAGITDTPLKITLTDEYLTIQDFGKGIPDDLIAPIYGIYGASTKKNDGRQTGGFGLGCKSPFAYTDHFEVTSCHEGTKTIYNMSKSSAELNGRPSITPIASFPSTDTGITVKIPLNHSNQSTHAISAYVDRVAYNGDIAAIFNEELLPNLGLDDSEFGMVLIPQQTSEEARHLCAERIMVRYGNVIYPIEKNIEYGPLYDKVNHLLTNHYSCHLVLKAPPDSISITPSRESLTSSDITTKTIQGLLGKFLSVFLKNQQLLFRHKELVNEFVDASAARDLEFSNMIPLSSWKIPGVPDVTSDNTLKTTDQFAALEVVLRYSKKAKNIPAKKWLGYIQRYFYTINKDGDKFSTGLFQSWARTFQRNLKKLDSPAYGGYRVENQDMVVATAWWRKNVLLPLVQNLQNLSTYKKSRLFIVSENSDYNGRDNYGRTKPIRVSHANMVSHTRNLIHLLKPTVFLTHNADTLQKRLDKLELEGTYRLKTYFIYEVGRKEVERVEAQTLLEGLTGIEYVDYTGRTQKEQEAYDIRVAEMQKVRDEIAAGKEPTIRVAKKRKKGMVTLGYLLDPESDRVNTLRFNDALPTCIEEPEAVMLISLGKDRTAATKDFEPKVLKTVAKLFGNKIGVTNLNNVLEKAQKNCDMEIRTYICDKVLDVVENSPSLLAYHSSEISKINHYIDQNNFSWYTREPLKKIVQMLCDYPEFSAFAPDIHRLSDTDKLYWHLWENMYYLRPYERSKEYTELRDKIAKIQLKPEIIKILGDLITNPLLGLIDVDTTQELLSDNALDPTVRKKLVDTLINILT